MAEQVTLNHLVEGSSPSRLTNARAWNGAHKAPFRRSRVIAGSEYQVQPVLDMLRTEGRSAVALPDARIGWPAGRGRLPYPRGRRRHRDHHAPDRAGATEPTSARIGMRPPRIDAMQGALVIGALVIIDAEGRDLEGNGPALEVLGVSAVPMARWSAAGSPSCHAPTARRSRIRAHRGLACRPAGPLHRGRRARCVAGNRAASRGSRAGIAGVEHGSRRGGLAAGRACQRVPRARLGMVTPSGAGGAIVQRVHAARGPVRGPP